ncbi:hypothetical protein BDV33DRAFT_168037 [Aspergillus novoparasiticus]|uniref:Uncharacterized protein n=1 Tax=Aspergillus novoparasiticus TaxID=986946 RepID=A0A5N6EZ86_9EURO|nr:hypothetical protein BDV33DRAFT_168037 [Aspergillus novoparasiticus]
MTAQIPCFGWERGSTPLPWLVCPCVCQNWSEWVHMRCVCVSYDRLASVVGPVFREVDRCHTMCVDWFYSRGNFILRFSLWESGKVKL